MSGFGYSRLNESGNGNNPLPKNQRYVPEPYNMNGNNPLPRRIKKQYNNILYQSIFIVQ
jgi:hypothetical protein